MAVNNSEFVLNQASTSSQSTGDSTTEPTWESLLPMFDTLTNLMSTMTPAERQAIMPRLEKLDGALDDLMLVACGKSFDDTVLSFSQQNILLDIKSLKLKLNRSYRAGGLLLYQSHSGSIV
ncbi:hypothetical protein FRC03_004486 [Tulasnella sp. 419]|nr:hypothetical protein FRC03_004486 [Tulasnella sp. 419]